MDSNGFHWIPLDSAGFQEKILVLWNVTGLSVSLLSTGVLRKRMTFGIVFTSNYVRTRRGLALNK